MRQQGPFDRLLQPDSPRDRTAVFVIGAIVVLGLILIILVLPPISILSGGGGGGPAGPGGITSRVQDKAPKPPEGWEALSSLYEISRPQGVQGQATLKVNLTSRPEDGRNLALYTFEDGRWRRLGPANLDPDGTSAHGEVASLPENVAVLRRIGSSLVVTGWLPPERDLDPEAGGVLTTLNPLDFSPGEDGLLLGSPRPRPEGEGLRVLPTIRALGPPEADAVEAILSSPETTAVHVGDIVRIVQENDLDGIDIDYRAVNPARGPQFTEFVTTLAKQLHDAGRAITITLPLPDREGAGFDTGPYDWPALAAAVDAIKLAPEVDQSLYYKRMEEALAYLTEQVDSSRILLVVGPFGHEKGSDGIQAITLGQALGLASTVALQKDEEIKPEQAVTVLGPNIDLEQGASGLRWDEEALAVTFSYPGRGGARTVWIENAFSMAFKLDMARRYRLGGIAVEDVAAGAGESNVWGPIRELADSGKVSLLKPNGSLLKPYWEASAGTLDGGAKGAVVWNAPAEPGTYEVTLIVSDGVVRVGQRLALVVGVPSEEEGGGGDQTPPGG